MNLITLDNRASRVLMSFTCRRQTLRPAGQVRFGQAHALQCLVESSQAKDLPLAMSLLSKGSQLENLVARTYPHGSASKTRRGQLACVATKCPASKKTGAKILRAMYFGRLLAC